MKTLKPLENLAEDLNRGDLVILRGKDVEYAGYFQDMYGTYANFNGFNCSRRGTKMISVNLRDGSIPQTELRITNYEVVRRKK
jgi:hypothetical protein